MTVRFYRYCHICGERVHMDTKYTKCECGAEPWGKDSIKAEEFTELLRKNFIRIELNLT